MVFAKSALLGSALFALIGTAAAEPVAISDPVQRIKVSHGIEVVISHAETASINLPYDRKGGLTYTVKKERLVVKCKRSCSPDGPVVIALPEFNELRADSGASVTVEDGFSEAPFLEIEAYQGAAIDTMAYPARDVIARAGTGGSIRLQATESLDYGARMGGAIEYVGTPRVHGGTMMGGAVSGTVEY